MRSRSMKDMKRVEEIEHDWGKKEASIDNTFHQGPEEKNRRQS